ncbi:transcription elongation factor GreA [Candidatus Woesebacteria bacterium]|nr:transcription elongation factor GreA [Candidatus Woesebacteria bacterium]
MPKKIQFTKEGHKKILEELEHLKTNRHTAAKDRLAKARAMGDLKENSEYHAAKEDLSVIVGRISELEEMLRWAEIIDDAVAKIESDLVRLGCRVVVEKEGQRDEYHIVGEFEANPMQKKLSSTSPIGQALLGKRKGEVVEVAIPSGKHTYTIVDVKVI